MAQFVEAMDDRMEREKEDDKLAAPTAEDKTKDEGDSVPPVDLQLSDAPSNVDET